MNSFDTTVEMMASMGADTLFIEGLDEKGIVTGCPMNSKTGVSWSVAMISDIEEAVKCKYPKAVPKKLLKLYEKLSEEYDT